MEQEKAGRCLALALPLFKPQSYSRYTVALVLGVRF